MNIGYYVVRGINKILKLNAIKDCKIHNKAQLCYRIHMVNSTLGRYSYVAENCSILYTDIGAFCSIAENCSIGGPSHSVRSVSTSPVFVKGRNIFHKNFAQQEFESYSKTSIGNDVWIGSMCFIKAGVHIGNGAVIGMGSIVTKDIPDYEIWAGNPARFIRKRFDDETINKLKHIEWWNWDDERINSYGEAFNSPENLFCELEKRK